MLPKSIMSILAAGLILAAGCSTVPSRSAMYRAAGEAFGQRAEAYTVMIDPYWLTGAEQGFPVEVVALDEASTFNARWDDRHVIRQRSDGRWEIVW